MMRFSPSLWGKFDQVGDDLVIFLPSSSDLHGRGKYFGTHLILQHFRQSIITDEKTERQHASEEEAHMLRIAERIAIEAYKTLIRWFEPGDPTTRRMLEEILQDEEEHADEMADLLAKVGDKGRLN